MILYYTQHKIDFCTRLVTLHYFSRKMSTKTTKKTAKAPKEKTKKLPEPKPKNTTVVKEKKLPEKEFYEWKTMHVSHYSRHINHDYIALELKYDEREAGTFVLHRYYFFDKDGTGYTRKTGKFMIAYNRLILNFSKVFYLKDEDVECEYQDSVHKEEVAEFSKRLFDKFVKMILSTKTKEMTQSDVLGATATTFYKHKRYIKTDSYPFDVKSEYRKIKIMPKA